MIDKYLYLGTCACSSAGWQLWLDSAASAYPSDHPGLKDNPNIRMVKSCIHSQALSYPAEHAAMFLQTQINSAFRL